MSDGHYIWNSQRPQLADVVGDAGDGVEDEENDEEEEEAGFRGGGREAFEDSKVGRGAGGLSSPTHHPITAPQDVLIFVIDVRSDDMFRPINDRGDVPVVMALRCFAKLIETKMLKSPSDLLSLVFFGTVGTAHCTAQPRSQR